MGKASHRTMRCSLRGDICADAFSAAGLVFVMAYSRWGIASTPSFVVLVRACTKVWCATALGHCLNRFWSTGKTHRHWTSGTVFRSEEHTSELQSRGHLVCRLLLEKKKKQLNKR